MPQRFFEITNTVALLAWIVLIVAPGRRVVSHLLCATIVPGLLAAGYAAILAGLFLGAGPTIDFRELSTLAGLRRAFADDWVLAAAWTHYLAFDMVVGAWIARDAVRRSVPVLPRSVALALTFLAGPVGFLIHLAARGLPWAGRHAGSAGGVASPRPSEGAS